MVHQSGWAIRIEDFVNDLIKVDDLIYYDGPVLSHYKTRRDKHYLFNWVDGDELRSRWLVLEVSWVHLYDYLSDTRTLLDLVLQEYNSKLIVVETDITGVCVSGLLVPVGELIVDYLTNIDTYFGLGMPEAYVTLFEESQQNIAFARHLASLRRKSVKFHLEPVEARFGSTMGAADIGSFLQRVTKSYKSYVEFQFIRLFSSLYPQAQDLTKALSRVLETAEPRSVFANHGSFEIDLAVDNLPLIRVHDSIIEWQKRSLQEYKHDVFDFDFTRADRLPESLADADSDQLRAIFLPIIQIANNVNYSVETLDATHTRYKTLKDVSPQNAKKVAPPKPRHIPVEALLDTELTNVLLELQRGQSVSDLTKQQLLRAMVSITTGDDTSTLISSFRSNEGESITFREPVEVELARVGEYYEARFEPLGINTLGSNARSALDGIDRELRRIHSLFQQRIENPDEPISSQMGKILSAFSALV